MNKTRALIIAFGLLVAIGGCIGYIKTDSTISLVAGLTFGLTIITSGIIISFKEKLGLGLGAANTSLLLLVFGYRYAVTHKFMPAGMMAILCIAVLWVITNKLKKINIPT